MCRIMQGQDSSGMHQTLAYDLAVVFEQCVFGAVLLLLAHIIRHNLHLYAEQLLLPYSGCTSVLLLAGACRLQEPAG